jgi:hypothetical protein
MPKDVLLIVLFIAPLIALIPWYLRAWKEYRRPTTEVFQKWRPWLRFAEPETGQQNHLPNNRELKTKSAVFWIEGPHLCLFRLRFGLGSLGSIGQISWSGTEIHVEGRVSPLTIAGPFLIAACLDVFVIAAYLLGETTYNLETLVVLVGVITTVVLITYGLVLLIGVIFERMYFRRAYREIKTRIWNQN